MRTLRKNISLVLIAIMVCMLAVPSMAASPDGEENAALQVEWQISTFTTPGSAWQHCTITNASSETLTDVSFSAAQEGTGEQQELSGVNELLPGETEELSGNFYLEESGSWRFEVMARTSNGADIFSRTGFYDFAATISVDWDIHTFATPGSAAQSCSVTNTSSQTLTNVTFSAAQAGTGEQQVFQQIEQLAPGETQTLSGDLELDSAGSWRFEVVGETPEGSHVVVRTGFYRFGTATEPSASPYILDNGGLPFTSGAFLIDLQNATGNDAEILAEGDPIDSTKCIATGQMLNIYSPAGVLQSCQLIAVMGDVTGTGRAGLDQLIRLSEAFTGSDPLSGVWLVAGDLNGSGVIDLTDLLIAAEQYRALVDAQHVELSSETLPFYITSPSVEDQFTVYYVDGQNDIPYISAEDALAAVQLMFMLKSDPDAVVESAEEDGIYTWTRENGSKVELSFIDGRVTFWEFNNFSQPSYASTSLDVLSASGVDAAGNLQYFTRAPGSFEKAGFGVSIDLHQRGINMIYTNGMGYLPLQTFADLFAAPSLLQFLYNGQAVFLTSGGHLGQLEDIYYSAPTGSRSPQLARFTYNELCLACDLYYGLKEQHNISSFDTYFRQTGLTEDLLSEDPVVADTAIQNLAVAYLSDLHSGFNSASFYAGADATIRPTEIGASYRDTVEAMQRYNAARSEAFPNGTPGYQEVGNTAYVTFDSFTLPAANIDYYETPPGPDATDTVGLIMYAHAQIMREDSPIENVVIDLSANGGGQADAAVFVAGWYLGTAVINLNDTLTECQASTRYQIDANRDGKIDESDSVASKNLYCLISPNSFSCGNLVPAAFKASDTVTLLGKPSGGGACVVRPLSMADGTLLQISGPWRLSTLSNGSFYDIDKGIEPDEVIMRIENFYDREALTEHINGLFR